ncbi:overexpressed in colon carcinoma 1 protein homolog [Gymnodraco acuticeps]|uniref:Overexpressed in colon carcinoma 1 protein homolog n=1 Tax=Gymnodraco acuticeps TaxID=8218 RepID=A0A6P8V830_GYMAC|nr:overexpressed in colon carcinoma 1 protein homolog [Gymnodraco acuticeps]
MGCGNSSPATKNSSSSSSTAGQAESSTKVLEESVAEEEKWKNYGGVYVGFPTNLSDIPTIHIGSLREHDLSTLGRPLWRDGS